MANYKRISEIATLAEAIDTTNILVEENGVFKKISSSEVGGGMPVVILKNENYDNFLSGISAAGAAAVYNYTCENATFEEVVQMFQNGEPFMILVKEYMDLDGTGAYIIADDFYNLGTYFRITCYFGNTIYWGSLGISTNLNNAAIVDK